MENVFCKKDYKHRNGLPSFHFCPCKKSNKDAENQRDQKAYLRTNQFARCGIGHPALLSAYEALSKPTV